MTSSSGPLFVGPDVASWQTVAAVAQPSRPEDPDGPGRQDDVGKSSPVGLLVLLLFFIAVAFLVRSMTKHLKKVPASFEKPDETPAEEPSESPETESDEKPADDSVEEKK